MNCSLQGCRLTMDFTCDTAIKMHLLSACFSLGILLESRLLCLKVTFLLVVSLAKVCHLLQVGIKIIACLKFSIINNDVGLSQAVMAELFGVTNGRTSQGLCQDSTIVPDLSPLHCWPRMIVLLRVD